MNKIKLRFNKLLFPILALFLVAGLMDFNVAYASSTVSNTGTAGKVRLAPDASENALGIKFGTVGDINALYTLTDEDKSTLSTGKNIELSIESELTAKAYMASQDVDIITKSMSNSNIKGMIPGFITFINITLQKQIQGKADIPISETNVPVDITFYPPTFMEAPAQGLVRVYYFYGINGDNGFREGPFYEEDGLIKAQLQRFGVYALAYVEVTPDEAPSLKYSDGTYVPTYQETTTASDIKRKIDSMTTRTPSESTLISPTYSPQEDESIVFSDDDETKETVEYENTLGNRGKNVLSFSTVIFILIIMDLFLIGGYAIYLRYKSNRYS